MTNCLEGKYLMLCNLWAQCNQCNSGTTTERYMRNHMESVHQGGGSLTNCVEVRPPFPGTAEWYSRVVQQNGTAEWYSRVVQQSGRAAARKQIRRDGHRRVGWLVENASARTMQSQSKLEQCKSEKIPSALVVRLCALWWRALCNAVFVR